MKYIVIGTAGHIDHGKTALVRALTGTDCDRFPEEQARGITIDIGFASLDGGDVKLSFIDVPGHERFVKNMLAGVWGIDYVLFVIAADESVMPQTREHFDILNILGVQRGIIAVTKTDLVDEEMVELVELEVQDLVQGTPFEEAPIVPVSAKTGVGVERLKDLLLQTAATLALRDPEGLFRLYIDRCFTMKGHGTVITGTVVSGSVSEGDEVILLPKGKKIRIRGIERHGSKQDTALAGQRAALNLQGVEVSEISRGDQLLEIGNYKPSYLLNVGLNLLGSADRPLKNNDRIRFHHGTAEILGRVKLVGSGHLAPGGSALGQLRLESPTLCFYGDRFVIRRYSPMITIGGGGVLDGAPPKIRGSGLSEKELLEKLETGGLGDRVAAYCIRAGARGRAFDEVLGHSGVLRQKLDRIIEEEIQNGMLIITPTDPPRLFGAEIFEKLATKANSVLENFHKEESLRWGMSKEELREKVFGKCPAQASKFLMERLAETGVIEIRGEEVRMKGREITLSEEEANIMRALDDIWNKAGMSPPFLKDIVASKGFKAPVAEKVFQHLQRSRIFIAIGGGIAIHQSQMKNLRNMLLDIKKKSDRLDIAQFKKMTGTSRKYAIPLLEHLDKERWTRKEASGERTILLTV
ncbi:selenocysteine-specific translation elongation factor [Acidobacteriota bacterium]